MAAKRNASCLLMGHRWNRRHGPNHTTVLTCRRCGKVDVVTHDFRAFL